MKRHQYAHEKPRQAKERSKLENLSAETYQTENTKEKILRTIRTKILQTLHEVRKKKD